MSTKYVHFTDEQKEQARQTDLCELLRSQGETLKRSGSEYEWKDGSQKVTIRGNLWFHQYDRQGGDAIDFVRRFYHKDYPEAVSCLLDGRNGTLSVSPSIERKPSKPFELPPRNENMRRVYAVKCEYLVSNPLDRIDNFKDANAVVHPEEALHFYTVDQYHLFDAVLKNRASARGRAIRVFFAVLFYTGARKGEAQALKWSDFDGESVWIRRSISQKIKGRRITETPPKNKSSYRKVSIPATLKRILAEHKVFQQADPAWSDVISDTTLDHACRQTAMSAGLPYIRIHDFRHSHASLLINANINIKAISARLGHARVEQTWNRYGHLYPEQDDRILDVLDKL